MENLETDGVRNVGTEEVKLLHEAKPLASLRLPPNGSDIVYFPIDENLSQYVLSILEPVQLTLMQLLNRAEMTLADVNAALIIFKQALNNWTITTENGIIVPEVKDNDYTVDFLPKYCLGAAAVLFLVFFILIILSSYYVDDSSLAYVAVIFLALGLFMHLCVIVFNGDFRTCKKRFRIATTYLNPRQRRSMLSAVAIVNKVFNKKFLSWKMEKDGNWMELRELTLQRSVSVKIPAKK